MKYYVGIDLGGTNIAAGVVNENFEIIARAKRKTNCPRTAESIAKDMVEVALEAISSALLTLDQMEWIGVGCPGTVNYDTGVVEYANNIEFYNVPLKEMLEELFSKEIYIENDANAAAFGEYLAGAAKGANPAVVITLGTGVGSGIIFDGKIYRGFNFAGAEFGHTVIEVNGRQCTCGRHGCLETYASATGLMNLTKEAMQEDRSSTLWDICGKDISKVDGRTAFLAQKSGDKTAEKVVQTYINYLACGIINIINTFQPEILCIGGGISKEGNTLLEPLSKMADIENYARHSKHQTKIVIATLGNDAGIIGAAFLGLDK